MPTLILLLVPAALLVSAAATWGMIRLAPRLGLIDSPAGRKAHKAPTPLGGGVAIFAGLVVPMLAGLAVVNAVDSPVREVAWARGHVIPPGATPEQIAAITEGSSGVSRGSDSFYYNYLVGWNYDPAYWSGARKETPQALSFVAAMAALVALGLADDRTPLGPFVKLGAQLLVTAAFVTLADIRVLTALDGYVGGRWPSVVVTVLWVGAITNAFNFLDNMDGLSAGVASVCSAAFLCVTLLIGQWFVAAVLALLLGSLLGFLLFNFPPAKIFMGDAGSLLVGFTLGVLTVQTTFLPTGRDLAGGWYAVLAPLVVLALPLYDMVTVSAIRLARGKSPFVGDTNHFSHRLVARGMSRRTAVLCLYLVTAATSVAAVLLIYVPTPFAAWLVFAQTLLILGVVALLEQHPLPAPP